MVQIAGGPGNALRSCLFSRISESRKAGRKTILLVPEQYTLQAERDLMTGLSLPGLLDLDVVSPTKLKTLVREAAGSSGRRVLDEQGRAMAVHQALHTCAGSLEFYRNLEDLYGAVPQLERTLTDLREEQITPEMLEDLSKGSPSESRRARFRDLSQLLQAYETLLGERFEDPTAAWADMCARLVSSGLWRGADLYIYGFDTIRPDLSSLILSAASVCENIHVLLTMMDETSLAARIFRVQRESATRLSDMLREKGLPYALDILPVSETSREPALACLDQQLFSGNAGPFSGDPSPAVSLYAASNPTAEAYEAVSVLRSWRRQGIPWNRMAIAHSSGDSGISALAAALRIGGIPFFLNRKMPVSRHGVSRLLISALAYGSGGPRTESLLEAACCGFGTLTREEGAFLTRYAAAHGIDRSRWRRPFTAGEDAAEMETLRLRLLSPMDHLHDALRAARDAAASAGAVFRFLQEEGIHAQLLARQQRLASEGAYAEAVIDRQIWDSLMNLLDQLWALLGGRKATLRQISTLITGALNRSTLSSLPEDEEGVAVGEIGHMLPGQTDALILVGMNDGVMAPVPQGLLSNREQAEMEERLGRPAGMDQARMGMMIRSDFYRTMTLPSRRLLVSFRLRDEKGSALMPGEPVSELRRIFPGLKQRGGLAGREEIPRPETPSLALAGLGARLRKFAAGEQEDLPPEWQEALRNLWRRSDTGATVRGMLRPLLGPRPERQIVPETAMRLFHGDRISISRLECYAGCPYKHFLRYGLRPLLQEAYVFSAADAGDFFHLAMEAYLGSAMAEPGWPDLQEETVNRILDRILSALTDPWTDSPLSADALSRWQGEEYIRRARRAAQVLTRFAANSDFIPVGTEVEFGSDSGAPPLVLTLSDGARVALRGKIDRLDRYDGPDGPWLRVLDLKSSEKELNPAKMARGEQLQLMIYLKAALQHIPGARPAGAMYFPIQDPEVSAPDPEAAEAQRLKNVQLKGVAASDEDVIRAMDRDLSPYSLPKVFNKDGSISKSVKWVLEEKVLLALMDAAQTRAAELCEEIRSGRISISPSVESERYSACTFCEFSAFCPREKEDGRPLPAGLTFADAALGPEKAFPRDDPRQPEDTDGKPPETAQTENHPKRTVAQS